MENQQIKYRGRTIELTPQGYFLAYIHKLQRFIKTDTWPAMAKLIREDKC